MRRASRVALPLALAVLGFLAVLAARVPSAPGRESRRLELVDLIVEQDMRVRGLRSDVRRIEGRLADLEEGSNSDEVAALRAEADRLASGAGMTALTGPGVVITLDDSGAARSPTGDPNDLVVHERDIQTAVNALWAAGAEAVAINGERLSVLSAVRCAGNTLLLHGSVHSPPYEISAIGDPAGLQGSLAAQPGMERLLDAVRSFGLELSITPGQVRMPAGIPPPGLARAEPVT